MHDFRRRTTPGSSASAPWVEHQGACDGNAAALAHKEGTVIEVTLGPEVITMRGTLSAITQNALKRML